MDQELLRRLSVITQEEREILAGRGDIDRTIYMQNQSVTISSSKIPLEKLGQRSKSVVAKPVVVMMVETWKAAWRMVSSMVSYSPRTFQAMAAMLARINPQYSRSSSSRKTAVNSLSSSR